MGSVFFEKFGESFQKMIQMSQTFRWKTAFCTLQSNSPCLLVLGLCGAQEPGCQAELSIVLIYQVGWEAFITLWHLYPSPSLANNLVRVSAFGSGLAPRGSHGTKETYAPSRFSTPKPRSNIIPFLPLCDVYRMVLATLLLSDSRQEE